MSSLGSVVTETCVSGSKAFGNTPILDWERDGEWPTPVFTSPSSVIRRAGVVSTRSGRRRGGRVTTGSSGRSPLPFVTVVPGGPGFLGTRSQDRVRTVGWVGGRRRAEGVRVACVECPSWMTYGVRPARVGVLTGSSVAVRVGEIVYSSGCESL